MEPFANALEQELGEKFYKTLLLNDIPIFSSESKTVGVVVSKLDVLIKNLNLDLEVKPEMLQKRTVGEHELIGMPDRACINAELYRKVVTALKKIGLSDYTVLMRKEENAGVVILTPKCSVIIAPFVVE
ncbi:MAG: hypothetical protein AB1485_07185 [Candidatus Thermoplasmatota archaeon]